MTHKTRLTILRAVYIALLLLLAYDLATEQRDCITDTECAAIHGGNGDVL